MLGLKRCLLILRDLMSLSGQRILSQAKRLLTLKDTVKQVSLYLKDDLFLPLCSTIRTWLSLATMKQCFSRFQSISASSYSKVTGILMRVPLFQSLTERYMLWTHSMYLTLGQSLGLAITVMAVTLVFCGLQ